MFIKTFPVCDIRMLYIQTGIIAHYLYPSCHKKKISLLPHKNYHRNLSQKCRVKFWRRAWNRHSKFVSQFQAQKLWKSRFHQHFKQYTHRRTFYFRGHVLWPCVSLKQNQNSRIWVKTTNEQFFLVACTNKKVLHLYFSLLGSETTITLCDKKKCLFILLVAFTATFFLAEIPFKLPLSLFLSFSALF